MIMKRCYLLYVLLFFYCDLACSQDVIKQFKDFVAHADTVCYEQKIQEDLNKFDKWLIDSLPLLKKKNFADQYRPGNVDLSKKTKSLYCQFCLPIQKNIILRIISTII